MSDLIISPFLGEYLVVSPGSARAVRIDEARYRELQNAAAATVPSWLAQVTRQAWGASPGEVVLRSESILGFGKATYELNLGCNYDCEHCYLGLKRFDGLPWPQRELLLEYIRESGALWLTLTGGEPLVDSLFPEVYAKAHDLGMMIEILTNGSRLGNPRILDLLTARRPSKVTVSLYGATAETYDGLTRRPGAFGRFLIAMRSARDAGIRLEVSLIITQRNFHEKAKMRDLAEQFGRVPGEYGNISPTIHGGAGTLPSQSPEYLSTRKRFTGCAAGHTSFHVDPHGKASICNIGRNPSVDLVEEGPFALARLGRIADNLLERQDGCADCALQGNCVTCMPLVRLFRQATAPLETYCQHREPGKEV